MRALGEQFLVRQIQTQLEKSLPHRTSVLGKRGLQSAVQGAVTRGRAAGFGDEHLVAYAAIELVFGERFGRDPRYPWAKPILENRELAPAGKMDRLREAAIFQLAAEEEEAERLAGQIDEPDSEELEVETDVS